MTPAAEVELKWEKPDEEGLVKYMCEEKGFAVRFSSHISSSTSHYKTTGIIGLAK